MTHNNIIGAVSYDFSIPLKIFGGIAAVILLFVVLHYVYVRKVTYTVGEFREERSYYEPRIWAIVVTVIILILLMGAI